MFVCSGAEEEDSNSRRPYRKPVLLQVTLSSCPAIDRVHGFNCRYAGTRVQERLPLDWSCKCSYNPIDVFHPGQVSSPPSSWLCCWCILIHCQYLQMRQRDLINVPWSGVSQYLLSPSEDTMHTKCSKKWKAEGKTINIGHGLISHARVETMHSSFLCC